MKTTRQIAFALATLAVAFGTAGGAVAQTYPNKPIRMIVPSTPGSPTDVMARLVAQSVSNTIGQPVLVEPRPGGGGIIGTKAVVNAAPDGYTLLFTEGAKHLMTPALYDNVGFDPVTDVTPVATAGGGSFLLVVAPSVPATTVKELVDYARGHPGRINFGFGQGTLPQLVGEMFKHATGAQIANIPYKGGAQAVTDMLGGRVQMNIGTISTLAPLVREGKLRALAVTSAKRNPELPDVPTMAEGGLPEVASVTYYGLFAPGGTPDGAVRRINAAINESLKAADIAAAIRRIGFEPHGGAPEDFATLITDDMKVWVPIVQKTGFQMN
jgi:tripartite-type tricarboxylate transporter receptor subunit TctC